MQAGTNTVNGTILCPNGKTSCTKTLSAPKITAKPSNTDVYGKPFVFSNPDPTVGFVCLLDSNPVPCTTTTSNQTGTHGTYSDAPSGSHTFSVETVDPQNAASGVAASVPYTWVTTPPDPSITAKPTNPDTFGHSESFSFTNADSSVQYKCKLDTGSYTSCASGVSYPNLVSGSHSFSVKAYDSTGTYVSDNDAHWTWVITPPDPSITAKPTNPDTFGHSESFSFTNADSSVQYKCKLDTGSYTSCASGVSYPNLVSGSHSFSVKAYDSTGTYVSDNDAHWTWVITPPDPTISSGPDSQTTSTTANFVFADDDSTAKFECNLDGGGYVSCPSTNPTYSGLSHGPHTLDVKATDSSGNYESTNAATYSWEVIPYLTFEWDGSGASAGWSDAPGASPINLTVGSPSDTTYAQFTIHDSAALTVSGLAEPTFTTDTYSAGSPRYDIDFSDGNYAFGYPSQAGLGTASWELIQCSPDCVSQGYMSWTDIKTAESGQTVADAVIEADGDQSAGTTDGITDFTFNGYSLSFFTN